MRSLVVFDSFFGNTELIANAIGKGLGTAKTVSVVKVDKLDPEMVNGIEVLVVGSPTRAFSSTPAIKAFLKNLPADALDGVKVAAFDTRFRMDDKVPGFLRFMVGLFGYADKPMQNLLIKKGGRFTLSPEGFFVKDSEGPLEEGEAERALNWGKLVKSA